LGVEEKRLWKDTLESKYGFLRSLDDRKTIHREFRRWKDLRKIYGFSEGKCGLKRI